MSNEQSVGVLGATSLVGQLLLSRLISAGCSVVAFTRSVCTGSDDRVEWRQLAGSEEGNLPFWVCVAPIWVLPEHFALLESYGVQRIVVISSTSRFTKDDSSDVEEKKIAQWLAESEAQLHAWAEAHSVEWIILRPTLIYGLGHDKNIAEIALFIRRFGFFPLLGNAQGLRQPIHVDDVAKACVAALHKNDVSGRSFNLSGGETLPYREMVERIFKAMGKRTRLFSVPLWLFGFAIAVIRFIPRYKRWSSAMAQRMCQDLVFDHTEARKFLGFKPRRFTLSPQDLPK